MTADLARQGSFRRPSGPRGLPLLGCGPAFLRDQLGFLQQTVRDYGDVSHFRMWTEHVYLLNDPALIGQVFVTQDRKFKKGRGLERAKRLLGEGLLTSEGELHRRQRRLAQPAFHRQRLAAYGDVMAASAVRRCEGWRAGEERDVAREMLALTMTIVGKTLFDAHIESEAPEIGEAMGVFLDVFWTAMLPLGWLLERAPLPATRRYRRAREQIDATIYRLIAQHRAGGVDRGDLLSMFLRARDEEGDGGQMTDEQLRDEVLTILFAGHETTALALTWGWYLLSQHPDIERRLHNELDSALGGRLPTAGDLPNLPYARRILAETLRLYPPAWNIARRALEPVEIGGYVIPARSLVMMSPWVTQRDARYFPDPGRFDPERWTPEAEAARPRFSYFPFGAGPRQCIGEGFAWMEGVMLLATIAQRWRMRLVPGHPVATRTTVTLRPKHGMRMVLDRR